MSDSPMRSSNVFARFRKDLDDLKRLVKQLASAPISHASITGPVVVGHRGTITAPSPTGGATTLSPGGAVTTAPDGSATRLADGVAEVQAGPDEPWVPLEQAILEQVPPASDGLPPVSPPTIVEVIEGFAVVYLRIEPPADPVDPLVGFGIYVNGVWTRTTFDTTIAVAVDASDNALPYDEDTSFRVSAFDLDGEGPLSAAVTGRPVRIGESDLAQTIIAGIDAAGSKADTAISDAAAATQRAEDADARAAAAEAEAVAASQAAATAQAAADGAIRTYYQPTAPTGLNDTTDLGDLWFDTDDNQAYRWGGSGPGWVLIRDNGIAAALAAAAAAQLEAEAARADAAAAQQAADAATAQATTAITAANGKNANSFSGVSTPPSASGRTDGDIHTQITGGLAVKEWQLVAGTWVVRVIDGARLTNLDAASITTGFLNVALLLRAGAIKAEMVDVESLKTPLANIGVLVTNEVYATNGIYIADGSGHSLAFDNTNGLLQTGTDGKAKFNLPTDPTKTNFVRGQFEVDRMTVLGDAAFRGTKNEVTRGASVVVASTTESPTAEVAAFEAPVSSWPVHPGTTDIFFQARFVRDGTDWVGISRSVAGVYSIKKVGSGGAVTTVTLGSGADQISLTADLDDPTLVYQGFTKVGALWYVAVNSSEQASPIRPGKMRVYSISASGAVVKVYDYTPSPGYIIYGLTTDGTYLLMLMRGVLKWGLYRFPVASPPPTLVWESGLNFSYQVSDILWSSADVGASRLWVTGGNGLVLSLQGVDGVEALPERWRAAGDAGRGIGWDGTQMVSAFGPAQSNAGPLYRHAPRPTARNLVSAYTWYDSDTGGTGTHETTIGPVTAITQQARAWLVFNTPPPADIGGADDPNASRLYVGATAGSLRLQQAFVGISTILNPNTAAGAAPPGTNNFPAGLPGNVRSQVPAWVLWGDGTAEFDDPLMPKAPANKRYVDGRLGTTSAWIVPTMGSSWVNYGSGRATIGYRLWNGVVYLKGMVKLGTVNTIFQLGAGYRLLATQRWDVPSDSGTASIDIDGSGNVTIATYKGGGSNASIDLSTIRFIQEA